MSMSLDWTLVWIITVSTFCSVLVLLAFGKAYDAFSSWRRTRRDRMINALKEELKRDF